MGRFVRVLANLAVITAVFWVAVHAESEPNAYAPQLDMKDVDGKPVAMYKGFIVSDEDTVSLVPELKATDADKLGGARFICGYRIYSDRYDIPFEAQVISHADGKAKLKVKSGFKLTDYLRKKYKFEIAAFDCGSPTQHSKKAHVVVRVIPAPKISLPPLPKDIKEMIDKNVEVIPSKSGKKELKEESPPLPPSTEYPRLPLPDQGGENFFDRPSYIVAIREATLYDSILRLHPAADKSTKNICGYEIISPDVPFTVDDSGNIRNTKALEYSIQKSYILSVIAKHCDGLVSKPAIINVQVSPICSNGWKELPTDKEYKAGSKAITPFADTWFDTCEGSCQENETMSVTVSLESEGQINTCNHDTYSIQSQKDVCGASKNSLELLPQGQPWTKSLQSVKGHEAAYKFDGKTAVKVPSTRSNHTLGSFFTLSLWMQHGEEKKDGHKEHILCNSDGDGMNRHHYSLFVHNCRLVFLLRKEADQVTSLDKFMPAEWRWTIPHVCDDSWHHYAISVDYPNVKLYVDGQPIQGDGADDNDVLEIVDDWALHPSNKVHFTQLTVGACWQGHTSDFGQYFDGALADVSIVTGSTETERVIKCMNSCGEKLQFHSMELLEVGMSVSFNTELTEITIKGNSAEGVKKLLRAVGYTNTNGDPKSGYRSLHVKTDMICDGNVLPVKEQTIPVLVSAITDPETTISGVGMKYRKATELAQGVDIFTELMILSAPHKELKDQENRINKLDIEDVNKMQEDLKKRLLLDRCQVRVNSKMAVNREKLKLPNELLVKYLLDTKEFDEGFDITGSETYQHYEEVLRETFYYNTNPDKSFSGKKFTVHCTTMNGKFSSNDFIVQLKVGGEGEKQSSLLYSDPSFAHAGIAKDASLQVNSFAESAISTGSSSTAGTVAAIVIVCVAMLVIVIIIAIVRIRSVQSRRPRNPNVNIEDAVEMEWDNSTLNITVNPLESDALVTGVKSTDEADADSDADSEDELQSSYDEMDDPHTKDGGLEWDNSTLSY